MDSFHGYDSWKCSAPGDERGYHQAELGPGPAERLMTSAKLAAAHLAGIPQAAIGLGVELPESVVREIAQRSGTTVSAHLFEPHPLVRDLCEPGTRLLFSFDYQSHGVRIQGQGSRPATAAEIAGAKP